MFACFRENGGVVFVLINRHWGPVTIFDQVALKKPEQRKRYEMGCNIATLERQKSIRSLNHAELHNCKLLVWWQRACKRRRQRKTVRIFWRPNKISSSCEQNHFFVNLFLIHFKNMVECQKFRSQWNESNTKTMWFLRNIWSRSWQILRNWAVQKGTKLGSNGVKRSHSVVAQFKVKRKQLFD